MRTIGTIALLGAAQLAGCDGSLFAGPLGPHGTARVPPVPGTGPAAGACEVTSPAASALSRLTRVEYDYAVEDLLGDTSRPARSFTADDVTIGFEVGGVVSPLLADQYLTTATAIAERATADLATLTGCASTETGEACARQMIATRARRAFRRPPTTAETDALLALYRRGVELADHRTGIQLVIEALLVSPHFLYHLEGASPDVAGGELVTLGGFEIASRLSFFLWRSIPDDELLDAAAAGELDDRANVEMQARRMIEDERAERGIRDFHRQWLDLDRLAGATRDAELYPMFGDDVRRDMRASLDLYIDDVMDNGASLDALFRGGFAYVNERLAAIYGIEGITGEEMRRVSVDTTERAGLLTQPALLTLLGKPEQSDPIHRGIFVRTRLLCDVLPPPPDDVDITPPEFDPTLSTRERFSAHREEETCAACHSLIDPIGFGFESYDAIGRFRELDEGHEVDATGEIVQGGDATGPFDGVIELTDRLATSETVQQCVARQWFRFASARVESADDTCMLAEIDRRFAESDFDLRELMVSLVVQDGFVQRRIPADPPAGTGG